MTNILIVDDHKMFREGLILLLEKKGYNIIDEAENGMDAIDIISENKTNIDIVLLDINMPIMNGLEVIEELKLRKLNVKTLVLTSKKDVDFLYTAVQLGADGYILKTSSSQDLINAINLIIRGENYIQPELGPLLFEKINGKITDKNLTMNLTNREREILVLISKGRLNKEIAYELGITEKTVKNHISNLFKKIKVNDRTEATIYAVKNKIIEIL